MNSDEKFIINDLIARGMNYYVKFVKKLFIETSNKEKKIIKKKLKLDNALLKKFLIDMFKSYNIKFLEDKKKISLRVKKFRENRKKDSSLLQVYLPLSVKEKLSKYKNKSGYSYTFIIEILINEKLEELDLYADEIEDDIFLSDF